jgi:hypothetical protein
MSLLRTKRIPMEPTPMVPHRLSLEVLVGGGGPCPSCPTVRELAESGQAAPSVETFNQE